MIDFIAAVKESITRVFQLKGVVPPTIITWRENCHRMSVHTVDSMVNENEKDAVAALMVKLAKDCDQMAFASEAWMVLDSTTNLSPVEYHRQLIEQYGNLGLTPNGVEVVQIVHCTRLAENMFIATINRPVNGSPVLSDWKKLACEDRSGRFANIMRKAHQHENQ